MRFLKTSAASATLGAAMLLAPIGPAAAAPISLGASVLGAASQEALPLQDVQFRGGGGGFRGGGGGFRGGGFQGGGFRGANVGGFRGGNIGVARGNWSGYRGGWGGYRGWGGYGGWGWGGAAAGLAAGALIGSALAAPYYYDGYYEPYYGSYAGGPYYATAAAPVRDVAYCMRRFRSFDPRTGTYLGYDGRRHPCP